MRKILLTSAGFENRNIEKIFLELVDKEPQDIRALFVPTAANNIGAIAVLPKCINDLLGAGIPEDNLAVYDLHEKMDIATLSAYDVIYFSGGVTKHLLSRINENGFNKVLERFLDQGGVYVGVSAGSIVAAENFADNLGYINCTIGVHKENGSPVGKIDTANCLHIDLTDSQAILIFGDECSVID